VAIRGHQRQLALACGEYAAGRKFTSCSAPLEGHVAPGTALELVRTAQSASSSSLNTALSELSRSTDAKVASARVAYETRYLMRGAIRSPQLGPSGALKIQSRRNQGAIKAQSRGVAYLARAVRVIEYVSASPESPSAACKRATQT
jgi:hypothetical protein